MLLGGDEFGRTQHGNNNAYCQDNDLSWFDWSLDERQVRLLDFARRLIAFRREHPVFRRADFLAGDAAATGGQLADVWWFRPDGRRMTRRDWQTADGHRLGIFLNGDGITSRTPRGEPIRDESFVLLLNANHEPVSFRLPPPRFGRGWELEISTAQPDAPRRSYAARADVLVDGRSLIVLRRTA
jgi:glycogen operon protein